MNISPCINGSRLAIRHLICPRGSWQSRQEPDLNPKWKLYMQGALTEKTGRTPDAAEWRIYYQGRTHIRPGLLHVRSAPADQRLVETCNLSYEGAQARAEARRGALQSSRTVNDKMNRRAHDTESVVPSRDRPKDGGIRNRQVSPLDAAAEETPRDDCRRRATNTTW